MTKHESLARFAAENVMGWSPDSAAARNFNPAESWADAGVLWEKAREKGIFITLSGQPVGPWIGQGIRADASSDSGPRALSLAIAKAFGYGEQAAIDAAEEMK